MADPTSQKPYTNTSTSLDTENTQLLLLSLPFSLTMNEATLCFSEQIGIDPQHRDRDQDDSNTFPAVLSTTSPQIYSAQLH